MAATNHLRPTIIGHHELASARPVWFFVVALSRHAAAIALVLALFDVVSSRLTAAPIERLAFIVAWSVIVSAWSLSKNRRARD
jgi:hypothetical protein